MWFFFTNVPRELGIIGLKNRWSYISKNTTIPLEVFIILIDLILSLTFFTFDNVIYKQTYGLPMDSPLSLLIADIVLQDIENKALYKFNKIVPLYYRYVDDIVLAAPPHMVDSIVRTFNAFHNRLKFTAEMKDNRRINFFDLLINVVDCKLKID